VVSERPEDEDLDGSHPHVVPIERPERRFGCAGFISSPRFARGSCPPRPHGGRAGAFWPATEGGSRTQRRGGSGQRKMLQPDTLLTPCPTPRGRRLPEAPHAKPL
jgi:hypothetical protein